MADLGLGLVDDDKGGWRLTSLRIPFDCWCLIWGGGGGGGEGDGEGVRRRWLEVLMLRTLIADLYVTCSSSSSSSSSLFSSNSKWDPLRLSMS